LKRESEKLLKNWHIKIDVHYEETGGEGEID